MWMRLDGRMALCSGTSTSRVFDMYSVARRSLGRHDPPNAKPGFRYAGEMLSWRSLQTRSITAKGSTPIASQTRAVSLANVILSAWKLLQQYLTISAARIDVEWNSHGRCPNSRLRASTG